MAETDLYPPLKRFLEAQGYEVKAEVRGCDIVARRGAEPPVIVEMKLAFSLALLLQGIDRLAVSETVYLAVPPPKRTLRADILRLCRRLGLGLLVVDRDLVEPLADPAPYRPRPDTRRRDLLLKEFAHRVGDPNRGGSTRRPLMTAYRQDALRCAALIAGEGPCRLARLRAETGVARAAGILQDDVYGWFCRVERGIYGLTPKGEEALRSYAEVVAGLPAPIRAAA